MNKTNCRLHRRVYPRQYVLRGYGNNTYGNTVYPVGGGVYTFPTLILHKHCSNTIQNNQK